jgi:hypothetical protein
VVYLGGHETNHLNTVCWVRISILCANKVDMATLSTRKKYVASWCSVDLVLKL